MYDSGFTGRDREMTWLVGATAVRNVELGNQRWARELLCSKMSRG